MLTQQCLPSPLTRSRHYLHVLIPVHSPWLPGYIDVAQTIRVILTMAGLSLDRPHIKMTEGLWVKNPSGKVTSREQNHWPSHSFPPEDYFPKTTSHSKLKGDCVLRKETVASHLFSTVDLPSFPPPPAHSPSPNCRNHRSPVLQSISQFPKVSGVISHPG